jgi:hypothetical protein
MTREEYLKARLPELIATMPPMPPLRKPKPAPEVRAPLVGKIAEAAKANPASVEVRVVARAEDGTTVIDRPRQREIVQVLDIEPGTCRPARARHIDCATGDVSIREYQNGYSQGGGVVSDYNPLDALKRD